MEFRNINNDSNYQISMGSRHKIEIPRNGAMIPVFAFPTTLTFECPSTSRSTTSRNNEDEFGHDGHLKKILTLYNPYEFDIRFKVLSTSPDDFFVADKTGSLSSASCVDLIVRILPSAIARAAQNPHHPSLDSKLRVENYRVDEKKLVLIGKKDVNVKVVIQEEGRSRWEEIRNTRERERDREEQQYEDRGHGRYYEDPGRHHPEQHNRHNPSPNYFAICVGLICIVGLMFPSEVSTNTQSTSSLPTYLHLTQHQKLLLAYVLGLVTMVLFRA